MPALTFSVKTYDKYDGKYGLIHHTEVKSKTIVKAGALNDLSVTFDKSMSNFFPAEAKVSFIVNHEPSDSGSGFVIKVIFPLDFMVASPAI